MKASSWALFLACAVHTLASDAKHAKKEQSCLVGQTSENEKKSGASNPNHVGLCFVQNGLLSQKVKKHEDVGIHDEEKVVLQEEQVHNQQEVERMNESDLGSPQNELTPAGISLEVANLVEENSATAWWVELPDYVGCGNLISTCTGNEALWQNQNWTAWRVGFEVCCTYGAYERNLCADISEALFNFSKGIQGFQGGKLVRDTPPSTLRKFCLEADEVRRLHFRKSIFDGIGVGAAASLLQSSRLGASLVRVVQRWWSLAQKKAATKTSMRTESRSIIQKCKNHASCASEAAPILAFFERKLRPHKYKPGVVVDGPKCGGKYYERKFNEEVPAGFDYKHCKEKDKWCYKNSAPFRCCRMQIGSDGALRTDPPCTGEFQRGKAYKVANGIRYYCDPDFSNCTALARGDCEYCAYLQEVVDSEDDDSNGHRHSNWHTFLTGFWVVLTLMF